MDEQVRGRIVRGLRAASGASRRMRRGTIALQLPHFRARLPQFDTFFDATLHLGTLNVAVPGRQVRIGPRAIHLRGIAWERGTTEHFYLAPCTLRYAGQDYRGLVYLPDPETKPAGLPTGQVIEVLTSRVPFVHYGTRVRLAFESGALELVPVRKPGRRSAPLRPRAARRGGGAAPAGGRAGYHSPCRA